MIILIQGFAGLVLVDNMHFQYNTLLFGLMFYSIGFILSDQFIFGAVIYTILLNMKHIFLYMAPAYFVFYLKYYVFKDKLFHFSKLVKLGVVIIGIFLVSFLPFIMIALGKDGDNGELLLKILKRMFPFKRGLLHAYWAPNFWAIYSFLDKVLFIVFGSNKSKVNLTSSGLNQDTNFDVLPNVTVKFANLLIIFLSLVFIIKAFFEKYEKYRNKQCLIFLKYLMISSLIFFNFGFQVHEKAFIKVSLLAIVYYIYLVNESESNSLLATNLNFILPIYIGIFAQLPLIHIIKDYFVKLFYVLGYIIIVKIYERITSKFTTKNCIAKFVKITIFIYAFICIVLDFIVVVYPVVDIKQLGGMLNIPTENLIKISSIKEKFQFLPLMLFSVINSVFVQCYFVVLLRLRVKMNNVEMDSYESELMKVKSE